MEKNKVSNNNVKSPCPCHPFQFAHRRWMMAGGRELQHNHKIFTKHGKEKIEGQKMLEAAPAGGAQTVAPAPKGRTLNSVGTSASNRMVIISFPTPTPHGDRVTKSCVATSIAPPPANTWMTTSFWFILEKRSLGRRKFGMSLHPGILGLRGLWSTDHGMRSHE